MGEHANLPLRALRAEITTDMKRDADGWRELAAVPEALASELNRES